MSAYYDLYETPVPEGEEPKSLHAIVPANFIHGISYLFG